MENVSFTGIKNLYIGKKTYQKYGSYLSAGCKIQQGNKNYTDIKIRCDLTNDADGNDMAAFKKTLSKCRPCYQNNCINHDNPQHFELLVSRCDVKDDSVNISNSNFKINNYDIMLDERQILPMFSFMAKLTKKMAAIPNISETQKKYITLANWSIHEEACRFIDNLY